MGRSCVGTISLILACTISMVFTVSPSSSAKVDYSKFLKQGQETDMAALLKRYDDATEEDRRFAQRFLNDAREDIKRQKWDTAAKSYGASVLVYPTVEGLLGLAVSGARIRRPRDTCEEETYYKISDLQEAALHFKTALKFHHRLGRKSDVSQETIEKFIIRLLAAQKDVFVKARKCLRRRGK